jgi:hypothetical protein
VCRLSTRRAAVFNGILEAVALVGARRHLAKARAKVLQFEPPRVPRIKSRTDSIDTTLPPLKIGRCRMLARSIFTMASRQSSSASPSHFAVITSCTAVRAGSSPRDHALHDVALGQDTNQGVAFQHGHDAHVVVGHGSDGR